MPKEPSRTNKVRGVMILVYPTVIVEMFGPFFTAKSQKRYSVIGNKEKATSCQFTAMVSGDIKMRTVSSFLPTAALEKEKVDEFSKI